jgi:hypothetical protein
LASSLLGRSSADFIISIVGSSFRYAQDCYNQDIDSGATVLLITNTFSALAKDPGLGPAKALMQNIVERTLEPPRVRKF